MLMWRHCKIPIITQCEHVQYAPGPWWTKKLLGFKRIPRSHNIRSGATIGQYYEFQMWNVTSSNLFIGNNYISQHTSKIYISVAATVTVWPLWCCIYLRTFCAISQHWDDAGSLYPSCERQQPVFLHIPHHNCRWLGGPVSLGADLVMPKYSGFSI